MVGARSARLRVGTTTTTSIARPMLALTPVALTSLPRAMSDLPRPSAADFGRLVRVTTPAGEREVDIYSEEGFQVLSQLWTRSNWQNRLSYEVTWLGIPIIQLPEDMVVMQELIWKVRPDVIVESGVAHGGALVLYASILELLGRGPGHRRRHRDPQVQPAGDRGPPAQPSHRADRGRLAGRRHRRGGPLPDHGPGSA